MSNKTQSLETVLSTEKKVITLKSDVTGNKLKRKQTNDAKRQSVKDARDEQRKLSFHYKQLQNFASNYIALLSKETGKEITVDLIQSLKYSNFLPFLTEREEYSNLTNGWTFNRLLSVVARYYRGEEKKQVIESPLSEIE
jgi:hypothetical protein